MLQGLTTQLDTNVRGRLISPDSDEYDLARKVYNGMINKYPQLIVRCADVADVIAAVKYAGEKNLLLAVRGGGHSGAGLGICDDGIVIDLSTMKGIRVDPISRTVRVEGGCTQGEVDHATHAFGLFEYVNPMPFPQLQSLFDPLLPMGMQWYWKGDFFTELKDEAIAQHIKYGSKLPTQLSTMHLYPIDGAANRVGRNDTAFSYREAKWSMVIVGIDPDPAQAEEITNWAKEYWNALHLYSCGGAYVNFMMEEGQERIRATYRDNYDRLVAIKTKYDPTNLFRVNQNIKPLEI